MPFPLIALTIVSVITMMVYLVLAAATKDWYHYLPLVGMFAAYQVIYSRLLRRYERLGLAIRIHNPRVMVKFVTGLPPGMIAARASFFFVVALMLGFGLAPLNVFTARKGIVASVFGLIATAILNIWLEHHYVKTGRAERVVLL